MIAFVRFDTFTQNSIITRSLTSL